MNEWVRRLRSSVQSVVDGKRRKSAASPQTDGSRRKTTHDEPAPPAATELELPPAETPQLSSLTKQRARGPPRRRPSPGQRTVSCPPTDDDPARFAWGRDPTIDPALFFSDVVGRCLSAHPAARSGTGSARLGSIAESDSQRSSRLSEGDKRSSRVSESGKRSSSGSGSGIGSGEREGEGERTDGDGESAESDADVKEGKEVGGGKADGEKSEAGVEKSEARTEAERPVSAGRKSPVLHLTGGQVEGAPKKRFCTLV